MSQQVQKFVKLHKLSFNSSLISIFRLVQVFVLEMHISREFHVFPRLDMKQIVGNQNYIELF